MALPKWMKKFFKNDQHGADLAFFRSVPIFQDLTNRQLGRIMQAVQKRRYHAGEKLFSEGQIGKAMFIIRSGHVELTKKTAQGESRSLGVLSPGQIFGEMALLEQMPRSASAKVVEEGEINLLYTSTLESLMRHHPIIGVKLMRNISIMLSSLLRRSNKAAEKSVGLKEAK